MDYLDIYKALQAPTCTKLKDILILLKKNMLLSYASYFEIKGHSRMNKKKLATHLCKSFSDPGYLESSLLVASNEELLLIRSLLSIPYMELGDVTYGTLRYPTAVGIIYLFRQKDTIYMLIPEEIKESYLKIDQISFEKRQKRIDVVHQYILAMTSLYGAFPMDMPYEVYNKQNAISLDYNDYLDIRSMLNERRQSFYIFGGLIVSFYFEFPNMQEELRDMLVKRYDKPFYIPPKNELLKYADDSYFPKTPEYLALKDFIVKELKLEYSKANNLLDNISTACSMGEPIESIIEDVNRFGVELDDMKQLKEFFQLVTDLGNNSRIWENGGHTPAEIFEKYEKPNLQK